MSNLINEVVLVIAATGKQGTGFCEALKNHGNFKIYGTSRTVPNEKLNKLGVEALTFRYDSAESITTVLSTSNPAYVIFITDMNNAAKGISDNEIRHGKIIVDACKLAPSVKHVIFSSGYLADVFPKTSTSKLAIEDYLKESGLSYTILRPGCFFENFDDPTTYNPLKKGHLKGLFPKKIQYIACYDTGRAAVSILSNYSEWNGKILNCVSYEGDGNDCAEALTRASGIDCKFTVSMSTTFLYMLSWIPLFGFLYEIVTNFNNYNEKGLQDIAAFKEVVPDAMDAEAFFRRLGKWHNGEKFHT